LWLACYTEEEIAEATGVSIGTVSGTMEKPSENDTWQKLKVFSEYRDPDWEPPLYDVW
jgi:transcriptional regulator with XRE-family HTH domain